MLIYGESDRFPNQAYGICLNSKKRLLWQIIKMAHGPCTRQRPGLKTHGNGACGALPIDEEGQTWLVGQHRFALDGYSWELPEGGGAKDVAPQISAGRELEEETGLRATNFAALGKWHLSNSVTDEVAYGFLAWGLSAGQAKPDPSEELALKRLPFAELVAMVRTGEITDAFTHLMVMSALDMARRGALPPELAGHIQAG